MPHCSKRCQNVCFKRQILEPVQLKYTLGEVCTTKKGWQGPHFFRTRGSQGPGRVSPGGSSRAAPSTATLIVFVVFQGLIELMQYHHIASVEITVFGSENSNHTLARCDFFYQLCFTKSQTTIVVIKKNISTTPLVKKHTLW
jgi:hypothetical protein